MALRRFRRRRGVAWLLIAGLLALMAAVFTARAASGQDAPTEPVIVARVPIPAGAPLDGPDADLTLGLIEVPIGLSLPGQFTQGGGDITVQDPGNNLNVGAFTHPGSHGVEIGLVIRTDDAGAGAGDVGLPSRLESGEHAKGQDGQSQQHEQDGRAQPLPPFEVLEERRLGRLSKHRLPGQVGLVRRGAATVGGRGTHRVDELPHREDRRADVGRDRRAQSPFERRQELHALH